MFIEPNTTIRILKGVPLDETYEHTIYFENVDKQAEYFASKTKYIVDYSTYQRVNKGSIKVGISADGLYDCNYVMYRNTNFNNKWFYAFIVGVEYVNNDTAVISIRNDDMQTWAFEYQLGECFVDREHSETDVIGEHTMPEGLELGGYITTNETEKNLSTSYGILFLATEDLPQNPPYPATSLNPPAKIGGYPLNCYWKVWNIVNLVPLISTALEEIQELCNTYSAQGKADSIISITVFPHDIFETLDASAEEFTIDCARKTLSGNVKNNKLYTYPFCCLGVLCNSQSVELKYELFNSASPQLYGVSSFTAPSPSVTVIPKNYENQDKDYSKAIALKGFPALAWINNYYQNWIAQNKSTLQVANIKASIGIATGVAQGIVGGVVGSPSAIVSGSSAVLGGIADIMGVMAEKEKHSIMPDTLGGNIDSVDNLFASSQLAIRTYCRTIRPEYLKSIDEYFTKFGYKCHRNKVPNTHSRPHWNYVKTISCNVTGSVPADSLRHIAQIYDSGITFWKNGNEIGNYNLDNSPN